MSIEQTLALAGMSGALDGQSSNLDSALKEYERENGKLYNDGKPIYSPEEHKRRSSALVERVQRTVDTALERVAEAGKLAALEKGAANEDPTRWLSKSDLETANARAVFTREDVMNLRPEQLAARLEQVLSEGNQLEAWLYARYVPARLQRDRRAPELGKVAGLLRDIEVLAIPKEVKERAEKAEALRQKAIDVSIKAGGVLREVNGENARSRAAMERSIRAMF